MTNLADKYDEWWSGVRCADAVSLTAGKTATQLYNGTTNPALWMVSLAMVNPDEAKRVLVVVLKEAATYLSVSSLRTRIETLSESDDKETVHAHLTWLLNRKKQRVNEPLDVSFELVCRYMCPCGMDASRIMLSAMNAIWKVLPILRGVSEETAKDDLYTRLRSEVSEATWKGPYT